MNNRYLILAGPGVVAGWRLGNADVKVLGSYGFPPAPEVLEMLDLAPGEGACIVRVEVGETVTRRVSEFAHA